MTKQMCLGCSTIFEFGGLEEVFVASNNSYYLCEPCMKKKIEAQNLNSPEVKS